MNSLYISPGQGFRLEVSKEGDVYRVRRDEISYIEGDPGDEVDGEKLESYDCDYWYRLGEEHFRDRVDYDGMVKWVHDARQLFSRLVKEGVGHLHTRDVVEMIVRGRIYER